MRRQAHIVVDLGFGDSGKGTVTDHLVRQSGARLVVRFNGGAQAGHTVVLPDGRAHTFSQFGAGTFVPAVRTHLSGFMLVHPGGLLRESAVLESKGVEAPLRRLSISPGALVISPFQQAANRLREVLRGQGRHGSCGLGIGETACDALENPDDAIVAGDLRCRDRLRTRLLRQQQRKWQLFAAHRRELIADPQGAMEMEVLESSLASQTWIEQALWLSQRVEIAEVHWPDTVVFEGAQGVLLDEWRGFHPYTTWSTCTFANALELLGSWDGEITRWGVLRSYATRHGAGPFPSEESSLHLPEPHNGTGPWQGHFRQGWLDTVLARYAIECCGGVDALAVTHLDRVRPDWRLVSSYQDLDRRFWDGHRLLPGPYQDLDYQEALGASLSAGRPVYEGVNGPDQLLARLEGLLQAPVALESWGPCSEHKRARGRVAA
jgi:adenylosuccinate synthase